MTTLIKDHKRLPMKVRYKGKTFTYIHRGISGMLYLHKRHPQLCVKRNLDANFYFFDHFNEIKTVLKKLPAFVKIYDLINQQKSIYSMEWLGYRTPHFRLIEAENRFKLLVEASSTLLKLFDEGYYWTADPQEDILIKNNKLRFCDPDSILPIEENKNFNDYYPWYWTIDES